jgi:hypothetical protein
MSSAVRYGFLGGVIAAAFYFLSQIIGLMTNPVMQALPLLILTAAIVLAQLSFKKANDGLMGYGKGLLLGVVASFLFAVISGIYLFIHLKFINTELLEHKMDQQALAMEQAGYGPEAIEQALASPVFTIEVGAIAHILVTFIIGMILSLIIAAIIRKTA